MEQKENPSNSIVLRENAPDFSEDEFKELVKYTSGSFNRIAADRAAYFMGLYLEGRSITQIHQKFPQWPKGALLLARYEYNWDKARNDYLSELMRGLPQRLAKAKGDVVQFLLDNLAVTHKEFAHEMELYLQNPNTNKPPRNRVKSIKEYREVLQALNDVMTLGQPTKNASPSIAVQVNASDGATVKITTNEHSEALKALDDKKN